MKKSGRKVLSVILTAVMVFALLPVFSGWMMFEEEEEEMISTENHTHDARVNENDDCDDHYGWTPISTEGQLRKLCKNGGKGYLTYDICILNDEIEIISNAEVSLCLNGWSIYPGFPLKKVLIVSGTLNLYDEYNNSGLLTHTNDITSSEAIVVNGGTFTMNGGKISNNRLSGVLVNDGTFTMNGGKISNNHLSGVFVHDGTFTMNGGKISENSGDCGGGVCIENGTFTMNGGKISENSGDCGGGVCVEDGTFTMNGGEISKNSAYYGGGVGVEYGTFTMNAGGITGNDASYDGGGVYVHDPYFHSAYKHNYFRDYGKFMMTGGEISCNKAGVNGGGVYVKGEMYEESEVYFCPEEDLTGGSFSMTGGKIKNNNASKYGNGVYLSGGTFTMNDGKILGEESVFVDAGSFTMNGGKIKIPHDICLNPEDEFYEDEFYKIEIYEDEVDEFEVHVGQVHIKEGTFMMYGGEVSGIVDLDLYDSAMFIIDKEKVGSIPYDFEFAPYCIITFNSNDKEGKTAIQYFNQDMTYNSIDLAPYKFTNTEMKFVEWNTSPDGSGYSFEDKKIIGAYGLDLYAQYIDTNVNSYNVTFKVENGTWDDGTTDDIEIQVQRDEGEIKLLRVDSSVIPEVGNEPNLRYKAGKWNYPTNRVISEDTTFIYKYEFDPSVVPYEISFDENHESSNIIKNNTGYDHKIATLPTPSLREGYDFEGWYTDKNDGTKITEETVFDSETTVYAHWKAHNYTVVFNANGGGGNMDDMLNREFDDNISLTANTYTFDGHTFSGWNTQADGNGTSYANESTDNITSEDGETVTLYAQWDAIFYDIKTSDDGNGTVSASATSGIKGTNISITASPNEGYKFAGWEVVSGEANIKDVSAASTTIEIGTSEVEVKATFEEIREELKPQSGSIEPGTPEEFRTPEESTEPETPEEFKTPEEPTEPGTEDLTDLETENPEEEIPAKDWLDDLRLQLQIAAELTGPQTVKYSGDFALSYDIMLYLVEHPDITLIYTVTYEGVDYTITILGGKAIADPNIPWYGPLWLLANYGGDNVPEVLAGSGRYTVVAGDTLSGIAAKFNTTVEELVRKNGIENPNYIIVGQVIVY